MIDLSVRPVRKASTARRGRSRWRALDRVWAAGLVGFLIAAVLVVLRIETHSGPPIFILPEKKFVDASVASPELLPLGRSGYDGQFVWRLAQDPFTTKVTDDGIRFDRPAYRQQRILLALIAHEVPLPNTTDVLVGINMLAVSAACTAGAMLARAGGRHALWGLLAGYTPTMTIGLARSLNEPLATALVLFGVLAWRRGSRAGSSVLFTLACLARETSAACVLGLGIVSLVKRDRRGIVACLVPGVVELGWQLWLAHVWGGLPIRTGEVNLGTPVIGPLSDVFGGYHVHGFKVFAYEAFRIGIVLAIAVVAAAPRVPAWLRGFGVGGAFLALTLGAWGVDVAFIRATTEVWTAAVLVVLLCPTSRLTQVFRSVAVALSVFAAYRFTAGLAQ